MKNEKKKKKKSKNRERKNEWNLMKQMWFCVKKCRVNVCRVKWRAMNNCVEKNAFWREKANDKNFNANDDERNQRAIETKKRNEWSREMMNAKKWIIAKNDACDEMKMTRWKWRNENEKTKWKWKNENDEMKMRK